MTNFKLNKEDKKLFRKTFDEMLTKYNPTDPNDRIVLTKNELDELLFDYYEDYNGVKFKKFRFYSKNYSKLDLSKVSLNNVSLSYEGFQDKYILDFTNTNMKFDFTKTYEYKNGKRILVRRVNFGLTDLSYVDFNKFSDYGITFSECNLAKANLILNQNSNAYFYGCNLVGNELGNITITYNDRENIPQNTPKGNIDIKHCILTETGINIIVNTPMSREEKEEFVKEFQHNYYSHCTINGNFMLYWSEREKIRDKAREQYEDFYKSKLDKICKKILVKIESNNENKE